jgi:hypothetical protein
MASCATAIAPSTSPLAARSMARHRAPAAMFHDRPSRAPLFSSVSINGVASSKRSSAIMASAAFGTYQWLMISQPGTCPNRSSIGRRVFSASAYLPCDTSRKASDMIGHSAVRGASQILAAASAAAASALASPACPA